MFARLAIVGACLIALPGCASKEELRAEAAPAMPALQVHFTLLNNATQTVWVRSHWAVNGTSGSDEAQLMAPGETRLEILQVKAGERAEFTVHWGATPLTESWRVGPYDVRAMQCDGSTPVMIAVEYNSEPPGTGWDYRADCGQPRSLSH